MNTAAVFRKRTFFESKRAKLIQGYIIFKVVFLLLSDARLQGQSFIFLLKETSARQMLSTSATRVLNRFLKLRDSLLTALPCYP